MPEGHVIHHQARRLSRAFRGSPVAVDSPQGRFAEGAAQVTGQVLTKAEAHGKHLFLGFDHGPWVHVHLGLFGKWRIGKGAAPEPRGEIRMRLQGNDAYAELRGPTACEVLDDDAMHARLRRIGPDPIRADADPRPAWERVSRSRQAVGALLMDQSVISGVGNIYRAEVLFRHEMSPFRAGRDVSWAEFAGLWDDLVVLMKQGAKRARIDTVRAEHLPEVMGRPARRDRHGGEVYVYRRAGRPCFLCGTAIDLTTMQGRTLYWCPSCQRS